MSMTARFRTRARTVDMLGRQQIAGIPTAISELFKNAHDAYANVVEVDYYRPEHLFILRDDGLGMTLDDFESKWLAIGTESKLSEVSEIHSIGQSLGFKQRQVLGEKGIGRLAIGAIGPQVLICTRALRPNGLSDTVVAFVNWSMYALPGVDIEDIVVPMTTLTNSHLPDKDVVAALVDRARSNITSLQKDFRVHNTHVEAILRELDGFTVDPLHLDGRLGEPSLQANGHGTFFYVSPVSPNLVLDIDANEADEASPLSKMLTGFSNTMIPNHQRPAILAEFRDHKTPGITEHLISERTFFTPEDFLGADHTIRGNFDSFGQFVGSVTLYRGEPIDHVVPWMRSHGRQTSCGPFSIDIAYVQGNLRDSSLNSEDFAAIAKKLELFGGVYIYRDGIRILPYGNQDYDFLRIEERRNKSAGYYYFSYRRLFGAIGISQEHNSNLVEKSGREGFQENLAYREFKEILENFFVQTAASFFRVDTLQGELFAEKRTEIQRRDEIARKREQAVRSKRRKLEQDLDGWFTKVASGDPDRETASLLSTLQNDLASLSSLPANAVLDGALRAERRAYNRLSELKDEYRVVQPRGIGLTRSLRRSVEAYRVEMERVNSDVFLPTESRVAEEVSSFSRDFGTSMDRRRRLEHSTQSAVEDTKRNVRRLDAEARGALDDVNSRVKTTLNQSNRQLEGALNSILTDTQRTPLRNDTDAELASKRREVETKIEDLAIASRALLESIAAQLLAVRTPEAGSMELISELDFTAATEEELLALREAADENFELVHLGQTVDAINHEFQATAITIRDTIRDLESWARANERLEDLYIRMKTAFDHLDGYLSLFAPLRKRSNPVETDIKGGEIFDYLSALFKNRFDRQDIEFVAEDDFKMFTFRGYRSTFYPVFVNLVDNAIFWLSDQSSTKQILLHLRDGGMAVSDTGPGVPARDRLAIFEPGFTRKPGGRGLGLHISRDVLQRVGYTLDVLPAGELGGATFIINPIPED